LTKPSVLRVTSWYTACNQFFCILNTCPVNGQSVISHGAAYLNQLTVTINNEAFYQKYVCVRTFTGPKSKSVPNRNPIGFEISEKKVYKQTNKHFCIYISRDKLN